MPGYRLVLWLVALISAVVGGCPMSQQPTPAPPQEQQSGYVGADVCMGCHSDLAENFRTTPHVKLFPQAAQEPSAQWGCEACHGPGEAHVAAGGGKGAVGGLVTFRDESARVRSEACLACHQKEVEQFHFRRSEHKLTGVACNDCHAPHFPQTPAGLLRQKTPDLCFGCHQETRATFALPVHHKVLEGAIRCTDCHTPHGSQSRFALRGVHNETCTQCH